MTRTKDLQFVRSQTFCGDHRPTKSLLESVQRSARGAAPAPAGGGGRGGSHVRPSRQVRRRVGRAGYRKPGGKHASGEADTGKRLQQTREADLAGQSTLVVAGRKKLLSLAAALEARASLSRCPQDLLRCCS